MEPSPLNIKTSALQRITKEKKLYEEELSENEQNVKSIQAKYDADKSNEDLKYTLKTAVKIRDETKRMIPNVQAKIKEILEDLKGYLKNSGNEGDAKAKKAIEAAEKEL
ncbi:hypothetical protein BRETT_005079 [Brettanomyces bruxellensis]|uniref:Tubulin-specific chaperone A n=1 Tax=Dekkera bruxellensis TaxID=5007 RepID=A0A871RBH9_DEKBR|nr:uncharacterized protein BRETT_005079 [Brettanomyces bruxellensis]QOU20422.1 hypothetical protein BRETT_005079 [Brettanomyces bruxellensis]